MEKLQHSGEHKSTKSCEIYQGSIVDEQGKEKPITEEMILEACKKLDKDQNFRQQT